MEIFSINISNEKGTVKVPVAEAFLKKDFGIEGDAHGGGGLCQISFLSFESIEKSNAVLIEKKEEPLLNPGDFAENFTTKGLDLSLLKIGDRLLVGSTAILEISQIGKICHEKCSVHYRTGDCIMPRECVFAIVKKSGRIKQGNKLKFL